MAKHRPAKRAAVPERPAILPDLAPSTQAASTIYPPLPQPLLLTLVIARDTGRWQVVSNAQAGTPDLGLLAEALGRVRDRLTAQIALAEAQPPAAPEAEPAEPAGVEG